MRGIGVIYGRSELIVSGDWEAPAGADIALDKHRLSWCYCVIAQQLIFSLVLLGIHTVRHSPNKKDHMYPDSLAYEWRTA